MRNPSLSGRAGVRLALAATILLGLGLRLWGLWYGLPHPLARPDEEIIVGHALERALPKIDPESFPYPTLIYYRDPVRDRPVRPDLRLVYPYPSLVYEIDGAAMWIWRQVGEWTGTFARPDGFLNDVVQHATQYRVARVVAAVAGALTPLAAFAAAWFAYRKSSVALVAALMVAVNFLHARDSHYATVDVPMTLLLTLALAWALRAASSGRGRDVVISGGLAGLAASAKFNAVMVVASTTVASVYQWFGATTGATRKRVVVSLVLAGLVAIGAFALTSPDCVAGAKLVVAGLRRQRLVLFSSDGVPAWCVFLSNTLPGAFGWAGFAAVLLGIGRALWKRRPADVVLLASIVPIFASMAGMTWVLPRYPLPLIPALAVLAAEVSVAMLPSIRWTWVAVLVVGLTAQPFASTVAYDRLATRPDTRQLAADWAASNLQPESPVAICRGYGAPVLNGAPAATRTIECTLDNLRAAAPRLVIVHTHPFIPFFRPPDDVMRWLQQHATPMATFDPFRSQDGMAACFYPGDAFYLPYCHFGGVERGGPIVTVWAVR